MVCRNDWAVNHIQSEAGFRLVTFVDARLDVPVAGSCLAAGGRQQSRWGYGAPWMTPSAVWGEGVEGGFSVVFDN